MPTLSLTPEEMAPSNRRLLDEINDLVFSAFWPKAPPKTQDLMETLRRIADFLRVRVAEGELSGDQAEKIMKAYVGVLVDREFASNLQSITGPPSPTNSGFLARWAMKFHRAVL